MLNQTQVDTFREKGFLLGNRVLSDKQVEELRVELARVIDDYEKNRCSPARTHCQPWW